MMGWGGLGVINLMTLLAGDLVWSRIKPYPLWPATVIKSEKDEKQHIYYTVKFLGENQSAKIKEEDIKPFDMGVPEFTPSAQILSKHKDLGKALLKAKEIFQRKTPRTHQGSKSEKRKKDTKPDKSKEFKKVPLKRLRSSIIPEKQIDCRKDSSESIQANQRSRHNRVKNTNYIQSEPVHASVTMEHLKSSQPLQKGAPELASKKVQLDPPKKQCEFTLAPKMGGWGDDIIQPLYHEHFPLIPHSQVVSPLHSKRQHKQQTRQTIMTKMLSCTNLNLPNRTPTISSQVWRSVGGIQSKLEMMVMLVGDTETKDEVMEANLREVKEQCAFGELTANDFVSSRITNILNFISNKLKPKFNDYSVWMKDTLRKINEKVIYKMNEYSIYEKTRPPPRDQTKQDKDIKMQMAESNQIQDKPGRDQPQPKTLSPDRLQQ